MTTLSYADELTKTLEQNSDEDLIKKISDIYKLPIETRGDEICKDVTLTALMKIAQNRKYNKAIKESGILNLDYNKTDVKKMSHEKRVELATFLNEKIPSGLNSEPLSKIKEKTDDEKDLMLIRVITALYLNKAAEKEQSRNQTISTIAGGLSGMGNALSNAVRANPPPEPKKYFNPNPYGTPEEQQVYYQKQQAEETRKRNQAQGIY